MSLLDLTRMDMTGLSERIRKKDVSPVEVARTALERIRQLDGTFKAFVTVMAQEALKTAQAAEKEILAGRYLGPMHGVPVGIKDIFFTKGVRTTAGSRVLADFVPEYDATVVARLKAAGAVIVGKTNTHEFAYGYVTSPTRNPWDMQCIPGGSSGGSGVAVAASMCMAATGSDTGGSIRVPAAMNGIVGLKPTFGRVSKHGVIVLSWTLDHVGPMTRTVEDAALMLNILAGYDPQDASSANVPVPDYTGALRADLSAVKLGIPKEHFIDPIDAEVSAAFENAVAVLKGLGAEVREVSVPHAGISVLAALTILASEAAAYHEQWFAEKADLYTPEVAGYIKMGNFLSAPHYVKAQRIRRMICRDFEQALAQVDAVITPTLPVTAPAIGDNEVAVGPASLPLTDVCGRNMYPLNMTGLPSISLPAGFSGAGLPIGLQVIGRPFDEAGVIRIAHNYEMHTDWHLQRPPV